MNNDRTVASLPECLSLSHGGGARGNGASIAVPSAVASAFVIGIVTVFPPPLHRPPPVVFPDGV